MMKITKAAMAELRAHAVEGYPNEICGMLIAGPGSDVVSETERVRNIMVERARDRYEMDPADQIRIQREVDADGRQIVGYYHSHPDHPARASATDSRRSWAGPVYLIVTSCQGDTGEANAFVAEADGGPMHPVAMEIVD